ncbi:DUF6086 family protein [Streptomyces sp. NPDC002346]
MSYPFKASDRSRILWDPSLRVGRFYVALAQEAGELNGMPTGLTDNCRRSVNRDPLSVDEK